MRVLFAFVALLVTVSAQDLTGPTFYINDGNGEHYFFALTNGSLVTDPALTLNMGTTYNFVLNKTMPTHPFGFSDNNNAGTPVAMSNFSSPSLGGVTTSGSCIMGNDNNPLSWRTENITNPCIVSITPPQAAAALSIYYRCSIHPNMNGALTAPAASTQSPSTTPPPTNATAAPTATPTPTTPPKGGDAACIVPGAIAALFVAINALFSA